MFEAKKLLFYYCASPVHMGAGTAIGAIDSPIQREVHTEHPLMAGSGIKGAARHHFNRVWKNDGLIKRIFGPETDASEHAGAVSFADANLVAFPVRSLKNTYVYATCSTALARLKRMVAASGGSADWVIPIVEEGKAMVSGKDVLSGIKLALEAFEFEATESDDVKRIAGWLGNSVLPKSPEHDFFRDKIQKELVVLSEGEFGHFVRHATVVEAHVAIKNETGTAEEGKLFYSENLPPESILAGLMLASVERFKKDSEPESVLDADEIVTEVLNGNADDKRVGLQGNLLQLGGDATTGRGLVVINAV